MKLDKSQNNDITGCMKSILKIFLAIVLSCVLLYVLFIAMFPGGISADVCMDRGGAYDYNTGECIGER